jgi:ABC-type lipoprotein release transport system permease subunit
MNLTTIVTLITEIGILLGVIIPVIVCVNKIANGTKCQLRSEMLRIYYHHRESNKIRQYEYENFVLLYEAYKVLKGNSFIDKIYKEVQTWEVVS